MKTTRLTLLLLATLHASLLQQPALAQSAWSPNPCDGLHADDFTCGSPLRGTPTPLNQVTCWNGMLANSAASCNNATPLCETGKVLSGGICVPMTTSIPSGTLCGSASYNLYYDINIWTDPANWTLTQSCQGVGPIAFGGYEAVGQCTWESCGGESGSCYSSSATTSASACAASGGSFVATGGVTPTTVSSSCPSGYSFVKTAMADFSGEHHTSYACAKN